MKTQLEANTPSFPPATPEEARNGPAFLLNELSFPPVQKGDLLAADGTGLPQSGEEGSMPAAQKSHS
jgi:hypothetical protein